MVTYLVLPAVGGWRVQLQEAGDVAVLPTFAAAERRARWLSTRASVKGHDSEILLLDAHGGAVGRWWAERYTPVASQELAA